MTRPTARESCLALGFPFAAAGCVALACDGARPACVLARAVCWRALGAASAAVPSVTTKVTSNGFGIKGVANSAQPESDSNLTPMRTSARRGRFASGAHTESGLRRCGALRRRNEFLQAIHQGIHRLIEVLVAIAQKDCRGNVLHDRPKRDARFGINNR